MGLYCVPPKSGWSLFKVLPFLVWSPSELWASSPLLKLSNSDLWEHRQGLLSPLILIPEPPCHCGRQREGQGEASVLTHMHSCFQSRLVQPWQEEVSLSGKEVKPPSGPGPLGATSRDPAQDALEPHGVGGQG